MTTTVGVIKRTKKKKYRALQFSESHSEITVPPNMALCSQQGACQVAEDDTTMPGLCTAAMVPEPGKKKRARAVGKIVLHLLGVTAGASNDAFGPHDGAVPLLMIPVVRTMGDGRVFRLLHRGSFLPFSLTSAPPGHRYQPFPQAEDSAALYRHVLGRRRIPPGNARPGSQVQ